MVTVKKTASIKPTAEADAHPLSELAASELMKVIALSMSGVSIRSYMGDMIEKLVEGGVLAIEEKEEVVEDDDEEEKDAVEEADEEVQSWMDRDRG